MIVSGTVTKKMMPVIVRLYNQMPEPEYVLAMGACASGGGPFKEGYNVVSASIKSVPVDVYVPGCPSDPPGVAARPDLTRRSALMRSRSSLSAGTAKDRSSHTGAAARSRP